MNRINFQCLGLFFTINATVWNIWMLGSMHCYSDTTSYNTTNKDTLLGEKDSRACKGCKELSLPSPPLVPCASTHLLIRGMDRKGDLPWKISLRSLSMTEFIIMVLLPSALSSDPGHCSPLKTTAKSPGNKTLTCGQWGFWDVHNKKKCYWFQCLEEKQRTSS